MHSARWKTPHHCDKALFEQLALEEAARLDFGPLAALSVWFVMP